MPTLLEFVVNYVDRLKGSLGMLAVMAVASKLNGCNLNCTATGALDSHSRTSILAPINSNYFLAVFMFFSIAAFESIAQSIARQCGGL